MNFKIIIMKTIFKLKLALLIIVAGLSLSCKTNGTVPADGSSVDSTTTTVDSMRTTTDTTTNGGSIKTDTTSTPNR